MTDQTTTDQTIDVERLTRILTEITERPHTHYQGTWLNISDEQITNHSDAVRWIERQATGEWPFAALELHDIGGWDCGTTGCLAGHVVVDARDTVIVGMHGEAESVIVPNGTPGAHRHTSGETVLSISARAKELLGLGDALGDLMFGGSNSLMGLWAMAERATGGAVAIPESVIDEVTDPDGVWWYADVDQLRDEFAEDVDEAIRRDRVTES